MRDSEFLQWIHDRMVNVHGEDGQIDYLHRLRGIIDNMAANEQQNDALRENKCKCGGNCRCSKSVGVNLE